MLIVSAALGPQVTEPMYGLSRQRLEREHHVEVARVQRPVLGLADRAARRVELGEGLGEPDQVLEVGHLGVAADIALADERAPVDGGEHHVVAADVGGVGRVAGLELELARRLRDLLEDELGVEPDAVLVLDVWPALASSSTASGSRNSIPISDTSRRQPRSITSIASSLRIS